MEWVGYLLTHLTTSLHGKKKRSSKASIMPFHNSSDALNFSRGICHQLRFLSTMGCLVVSLIGFQTGRENEHEKLREDTCQICQPPPPEPCVCGPPYDVLMINQDFLGGEKKVPVNDGKIMRLSLITLC